MILNAIRKFVKKHKTIPAPAYLEDDPWFGPATLSENQISIKESRAQLEAENLLIPESEDQPPSKEVANIHEVMYNIATSAGKTTVQLDPSLAVLRTSIVDLVVGCLALVMSQLSTLFWFSSAG